VQRYNAQAAAPVAARTQAEVYAGSDGNRNLARQGFAGGLDRGATVRPVPSADSVLAVHSLANLPLIDSGIPG
jgi:hypothetical protein